MCAEFLQTMKQNAVDRFPVVLYRHEKTGRNFKKIDKQMVGGMLNSTLKLGHFLGCNSNDDSDDEISKLICGSGHLE